MSPTAKPLDRRWWTWWPRDVGLGASFRRGVLRADMSPARSQETGLTRNVATVWTVGEDGGRRLVALVEADTHWECAERVEAFADLYDRAGRGGS